ncbi:hypothetical protein BDZ89DRAFT_915710, partial [Hymenopellis radicata]
KKGYLLVAHTAFQKDSKDRRFSNRTLKLRRTKVKYIFGASLEISNYDIPSDPNILKGLESRLVEIPTVYFPPGSIMLFETELHNHK